MKKIEILMATYNGEKYLKEQLNSIIKQTYRDWSLIIRDDGSSDSTNNILEKYSKLDNRIKILKDEKGNLGYKKNFETLMKISSGDYIFLCDQDDIWENNKIETCLKYLEKYQVVHHNANVYYQEELKSDFLFDIKNLKKNILKFIFPNIVGCCMAFRKEILKLALPIPENYPGHDTWIGFIAEIEKEIKYIDDKLITYRRHSNTTSTHCKKSKNSLIKKLKYRYYYLFYPLFRILKFKLKKKEKNKIVIDCMHTKEIFISLILYFINNNVILLLRESPYVEKNIISNIKKEIHGRVLFYKFDNTCLVKKITSRLKEWIKVLEIALFYRDVNEIILFREGNILFNVFKKHKKITLYEHGMINYQKVNEMFHGKKITKLQKFILSCFGETIGTYGRDKKVKEIYLNAPEKAPLDIIKKVKKLNINEKWRMLKKEDKDKITKIFGVSNLDLKDYNEKIILITQPLSEQGFITEEEKIDIYKKILSNYKDEEIIIKVHPREKTDYKKFFNCKILNKEFPLEILNFEGVRFKKAITLYSTAIDTFDYNLEKERLGTGISENLKRVRGDL